MWRAALRRRVSLPSSGCRASGSAACWSCGRPFLASAAPPRFCPACRALQPPESGADLFRLMGCERTFRLDVTELRRRFRSLQRRLHPDFFGARPQLELKGVELEKGTDSEADPEFLSVIMEINEKLTEANNEDTREEMEKYIAAKQEELAKEVSEAFDQDDLQKAKKVLAKMKYFANLEEKVKRKKIPS